MSRVVELRRVMELEVVLAELVPAVRRRIALEADRSLSDLHRAVQAAMGWHDLHVHRFRCGETLLGVPGTLPDVGDQSGVRIGDLLRSRGDRIEYLYDPRDVWLHEIRLERLRPGRPEEVLPACLEGERSCPPESCGGPRAYAELVTDLSQPESAAGRRAHEWLGGFFFPELFDLAEANRRLEAAFGDRKRGESPVGAASAANEDREDSPLRQTFAAEAAPTPFVRTWSHRKGVPMQAISMRCHALDPSVDVLVPDRVEVPDPGPDEVRVGLRACALNFPDVLMIRGEYQYRPELPFAPGMEASGVVESVGAAVDDLAVGDAVVVAMRCGGLSEAVTVPRDSVRPKPARLDHARAAGFSAAYLTAWVALVRRGALQPGETLLVHGAAGGVGLAAVDLGRHLGARVLATAGTEEKRRVVAALGADEVIDYSLPDGRLGGFRERVKELTEGRGADVIYDPVGGDVFEESLRCIAWNGRLLVIGFTSGRIGQVPSNIPLIKGFSVVGVRAGEYGRRDPVAGRENRDAIFDLAERGAISPHVCAHFPLEQASEALQMLVDRRAVGKVVVTMNGWEPGGDD